MAIIKPPVLPTWADSGDKVQPSDVEIATGWPVTNVPPSRQRFNWFFNYVMNGVRYFTRRGLPDWDAVESYEVGDSVIGPDGKVYRAIQAMNVNKTPSTQPAYWKLWVSDVADVPGRLLATQIISSTATYTPTAGTKKVRVKLLGAGGAGGGASVTSASETSVSGGGASGSYAEFVLTSGFSGLTVTIGTGGSGVSGAAGGNGGVSFFGALVTCPGGNGAGASPSRTTLSSAWGGGRSGATPTAAVPLVIAVPGFHGVDGVAYAISPPSALPGNGAPSFFGGGAPGTPSSSANGVDSSAPGSGGSGASNLGTQAATRKGGNGASGYCIIEEYS